MRAFLLNELHYTDTIRSGRNGRVHLRLVGIGVVQLIQQERSSAAGTAPYSPR